jgi:AcrR family transcriptional regulator
MRADARRNRERILAAARELFAGEPPEVQMDDLARRAGVGVGTVYRHFPDKEALMGELVRERFALFNEQLRLALDAPGEASADALAQALRASAEGLADDAATRFAFMSGGERVFAHAALEADEFMRLAEVLVRRARRAGLLAPGFRAEDIPMMMCGVCSTMGRPGPGWDWRRHFELLIRGMRAR